MKKRTHIKVKRGLLSEKHYFKMGSSIWLYLYILDNTDWNEGIMKDYTDNDASEKLGIKKRTVRDWRQRLEREEYIACRQTLRAQIIYVNNWSNPREDWSGSSNEPKPEENIFSYFQSNISILTPKLSELVGGWIDEYPEDWIRDAIDIAVKNSKRSFAYCDAILKRWKTEGKDSGKKPAETYEDQLAKAGYR